MSKEDIQTTDQVYELDAGGALDWEAALKELEDFATPTPLPVRKTPPAAPAETPAPITPQPVARPQQAAEERCMDVETRFAEVLTEVNKAMNQLRRFEQAHAYLIAPNVFRVWEDSLKETSMMMTREYHRLREDDEE